FHFFYIFTEFFQLNQKTNKHRLNIPHRSSRPDKKSAACPRIHLHWKNTSLSEPPNPEEAKSTQKKRQTHRLRKRKTATAHSQQTVYRRASALACGLHFR